MRNQTEYSKLDIEKLFQEAINDIQFMQRSRCSKTSIEMRQVLFFDTGIPLITDDSFVRKRKNSSI